MQKYLKVSQVLKSPLWVLNCCLHSCHSCKLIFTQKIWPYAFLKLKDFVNTMQAQFEMVQQYCYELASCSHENSTKLWRYNSKTVNFEDRTFSSPAGNTKSCNFLETMKTVQCLTFFKPVHYYKIRVFCCL